MRLINVLSVCDYCYDHFTALRSSCKSKGSFKLFSLFLLAMSVEFSNNSL